MADRDKIKQELEAATDLVEILGHEFLRLDFCPGEDLLMLVVGDYSLFLVETDDSFSWKLVKDGLLGNPMGPVVGVFAQGRLAQALLHLVKSIDQDMQDWITRHLPTG